MNQYDFTPHTAPPSGFVKTARAVVVALFVLGVLALGVLACLAG